MTILAVVAGALFLIIQGQVCPHLAIWGIQPNLLLPYAILCAVHLEIVWALPLCVFYGLGLDMLYPQLLGANSLALAAVVGITARIHHNIDKQKFLSTLLLLLLLNVVYHLVIFLLTAVSNGVGGRDVLFLLPAVIYNTAFSLLAVYLWGWFSRVQLSINE